MAGFFKKIFGKSDVKLSDADGGQGGVSEGLDITWLAEIVRFFPIGDKISYYPEYQKEIVLETIVLGYGINKHLIYSPVDIRFRQNGGRDVLHLTVDGYEKVVSEVEKFCFLIPFNREDETKLDYMRRVELGPQGAFRRNNTVTLVAYSNGGALSSVDTTVRRILPLESGIYAGNEIVLLDADPDSLTLTDQRQHHRLPTFLPAELTIGEGPVYPCTLLDFSNEFVQLQFEKINPGLVALTESRRLILAFNIDHGRSVKEYRLSGVMYRKGDATLVMRLQGIYKDGKPLPLGPMDILDIKSNLLRHPATHQALKEEGEKKNATGL